MIRSCTSVGRRFIITIMLRKPAISTGPLIMHASPIIIWDIPITVVLIFHHVIFGSTLHGWILSHSLTRWWFITVIVIVRRLMTGIPLGTIVTLDSWTERRLTAWSLHVAWVEWLAVVGVCVSCRVFASSEIIIVSSKA